MRKFIKFVKSYGASEFILRVINCIFSCIIAIEYTFLNFNPLLCALWVIILILWIIVLVAGIARTIKEDKEES